MIDAGCRVRVQYVGRLDDGTVFDSSEAHGGTPLEFVIGSGTVISGLEKAVCELNPHERRTVRIPAAEAYGNYDESLIENVPRAGFPSAEQLPVGEYIVLDIDGERKRARVLSVDEDEIAFDFNHEFAGRDLEFDLEVVDVAGVTGSLIENEEHAAGCTCGCHKLQKQLLDN
ncbi:peptidylprolyl isomerase [Adlercreutzia sp. R25]|uniref:Peptidyl-prolyl cis-trans isomerase n=1 Tax=Adlercreutzia shanghongiae TaxID=3111773 RepID=A0ABU6J138_9ACTN|nr:MULTISPECIES: peptidylprolyl isomerase [unclassified Adlercreutzia]MEC4273773.1 peptidylprolyl isomerase [Adlercreutzia sp. R25]MEC4295851.1 peptidylprolyl isomerase [Adlercreutzia sp. R22]